LFFIAADLLFWNSSLLSASSILPRDMLMKIFFYHKMVAQRQK